MTLFSLLFFVAFFWAGYGAYTLVAGLIGGTVGIIIGSVAAFCAVFGLFKALKIWANISHRKHCRKMAETYTRIFRVKALPDTKGIINPKNQIQVGDYGWESAPFKKDGLIYLQGFDEKWKIIWLAGFQEDQLELMGPKPFSQYYRYLTDHPEILKTPCPFPVQPRSDERQFAN
ncbi:MAG TPA: hypothetical protein VH255_04585 [Verrucomicrobiae bacterium]|jgi:hypothetical protein|nr:hypothetical protein [Verrucomicrobiae bacterium]